MLCNFGKENQDEAEMWQKITKGLKPSSDERLLIPAYAMRQQRRTSIKTAK